MTTEIKYSTRHCNPKKLVMSSESSVSDEISANFSAARATAASATNSRLSLILEHL